MSSIDDITDGLEAFRKLEPKMKEIAVLEALVSGSLKYEDVSGQYVKYLEKTRGKYEQSINKAGHWLTLWFMGNKSQFTKSGSAYWLDKHGVLSGAGSEKDLKKQLKDYPYSETEDGMPKTELTP